MTVILPLSKVHRFTLLANSVPNTVITATCHTDTSGRELMTGELEPLKNPQGQVIGFLAVGLNDSGTDSTFTVHALCYTPSS